MLRCSTRSNGSPKANQGELVAKQRKRAAQQKQRRESRSITEQARRARESTPAKMPPWQPFWIIGAIGIVAGIIALVWLVAVAAGGGDIDALAPRVRPDVPRGAMPVAMFLIGGSFLFTGELLRRAAWERRAMQLLSGGTTVVQIPPMRTGVVVSWMLVPVLGWIALVPVPLALVSETARHVEDLWFLSTIYGFLAAGFAGLFVISLVKRLAYRLFSAASSGGGEQRFWRVGSVQWRIESWVAFIGVGVAGVLPLVAVPGGPVIPSLFWILATIAASFSAAGIGLALASPRSGFAYGVAESVI